MSYFDTLRNSYTERYSNVPQDDDYYYLYKHFSYGAKDTEWEFKVLDTFHNCCLLFSKPNTFNDPYDCYCIIDYDFTRITRAELEGLLKKRITNKEFKLKKDVYIRDIKSKEIIKNWGDFRRNGFHLTCFNNSPLHILMWSHYACNHQGFMVEFKFKKDENKFNGLPVPVIYCNDFPKILYPFNASTKMCLQNNDFGSEVVIKLFANKAECWSYENEFRLIDKEGHLRKSEDKTPVTIDNDQFASVIFGHKTSEKCIKETKKAIDSFNLKNNKDIKIYNAQMMKNKYEIHVPGHPRLDKK